MGSTDRRPPAGRSSSEARPVSARAASLAPSSKRPSTVAPRPWSVRAYAHRLRAVRAVRRSAPRATRSTEPGRLAGLLGPARDEIGRLFPEMDGPARTPGGGELRPPPEPMEADRAGQGRLFEAILTVFERLGRNGPIVLAIEDIQWADVGTEAHRVPVAKPPEPAGGTARDAADGRSGSARPDHAPAGRARAPELGRADRARTLERSEVASLLREIGSGRWSSAQIIDGVLARSGGNPFFIEQLAAADGGEPADRRLPPGLRDVLAGRLGALPERTRQVLRGAAAAGRRVDEEYSQRSSVSPFQWSPRPCGRPSLTACWWMPVRWVAATRSITPCLLRSPTVSSSRASGPASRGVRPRTGTTR